MKWNSVINLDEHNVWFTSDLHLYHSNILWMNKRPFADVDEMWEHFRDNWNAKVKDEDYVFILGDVVWGSQLSRLQSMKDHLRGHICIVLGNHDKEKYGAYHNGSNFSIFESVERSEFIRFVSEKKGIDQNVFMSHYPALSWPAKARGSIHLHGHVHGMLDEFNEKSPDLRVDVGVDGKLGNMDIISFDDVYEYMIHKAGDIPLAQYMKFVYTKNEEGIL